MIIPAEKTEREFLYAQLVKDCFASRTDRLTRYDIYRNWYLYGNAENKTPTEYNKLFSHIDQITSFLFSGETTQFIIEVPQTGETNYQSQLDMSRKLTPKVNDTWHDSNIDLTFNDALVWALVFDTTFLKFVPEGKNQFMSYVIEPHSIGVLREDIPTLDDQECIAHEFFMSESVLRRRIAEFGQPEQDKFLALLQNRAETKDAQTIPGGVQTLIFNSQSATAGDEPNPLPGAINNFLLLNQDYEAVVSEKGITCYELWIYDDDTKDYRKATMVNGELLLHDSQTNPFVQGEHPFIKITPNPMYNYFWGRSELVMLIRLQDWMNTRIAEIKEILSKLAHPPISGFGTTEPFLKALQLANGIGSSDNPSTMGKVEMHYPPAVADLFKEVQMIEAMYEELSGIRSIMKGGGEPGVRAMAHADMLAKMGSSRVKKKAAILEDSVEKVASIILKCLRKFDDTHYKTDSGLAFIAKQLTSSAMVKVDSHSSSPIFVQEQKDTAFMLFKTGAIDEEDLIDAVRFQNSGYIKEKLKKRIAAKAAQAKAEADAEAEKNKPTTPTPNKG
jgi:hypothetical protein